MSEADFPPGYDDLKAKFKKSTQLKPRLNGYDCPQLILKSGKDFDLRKIDWLWPGWLAAGKLHLLAGAKAAGKSTTTFDLMARLTIGGLWPDGSLAPLGDVVIWSGEDDIEDTILPRFAGAGGDLARIYPIRNVFAHGQERPFDPSTDIPALTERVEQLPALKLVVIDPMVMALPAGADSHKNAETRRGLQPLVDFAERRNIALLGITHFGKGTADRDPVERVTGSLAFGALPRCIWGASSDDDGRQRRLVRMASNIGPSGGGIEYTLYQEPLSGYDFSIQRVAWGDTLSGSAAELLNLRKQTARSQAGEFLREFLRAGASCSQSEIKAAAEAHGHAWATVRRAQLDLAIKPVKVGKHWHWKLPWSNQDAQDAQFH
jgi:hypothetical protein